MAYTFSQLEGYWEQAGGSSASAPIAAAIALAESSGENVEQQGQPYSDTGWGLWQITPGNSYPGIGSNEALLNPEINAKAAVQKYKDAGNSFAPWTTFTSGKYKKYLQGDVAASTAPGGGSDASTTGLLGWPSDITGFFGEANDFVTALMWIVKPSSWLRIGAFGAAVILFLLAIWIMTRPEGQSILPSVIPVPV